MLIRIGKDEKAMMEEVGTTIGTQLEALVKKWVTIPGNCSKIL